jgi:predicted secreted protein
VTDYIGEKNVRVKGDMDGSGVATAIAELNVSHVDLGNAIAALKPTSGRAAVLGSADDWRKFVNSHAEKRLILSGRGEVFGDDAATRLQEMFFGAEKGYLEIEIIGVGLLTGKFFVLQIEWHDPASSALQYKIDLTSSGPLAFTAR